MNRTTIRDIAREAGVCIATVSRVINNKDNVLPETRQRILKIIARRGYRPNAIGRGLVSRRSYNILFEHFSIADPYCVALANSISAQCRAIGYRMLLANCEFDSTLEARYLQHVRDGSVDGIIISPMPTLDNVPLFRELAKNKFPMVVMDNPVPAVRTHCVKYDDHAAAAMAMDYLFQKGHRHIAFIQREHNFQTVRDRRQSFLESYRKRRLKVKPEHIITLPYAFEAWDTKIFDNLLHLPARPTALLTENEIVAVAVMNILIQRGIKIPDEMAVMAIGDALLDPLVPVPLTAVSLYPEQAAIKAVEFLVELIECQNRRQPSPRVFVQKPGLIVRNSA